MSQLESAVEAHLIRSVMTAGALTYKLAPTTAGVPDRLVVWPSGRVDFVEVKAEGGRLSSVQKVRIRDLEANAANVFVVHGKAEVILGKQRHGPTGTVELQFDANITRFSNLAQSERLPEQM